MTIITCPSCQAGYRFDPGSLTESRKVRCARCRTEWAVDAPSAATVKAAEPIPALEDVYAVDAIEFASDAAAPGAARETRRLPPARGRTTRPVRRPSMSGKLFRFVFGLRPVTVVAAASVAALGLAVGERVAVVRAAPSLAALYAAIGLPVNVRGLSISDVRSTENVENGVPVLLVTGMVENVSAARVDVPRLKLSIRASDGRELYAWTTMATRASLAPADTAAFRARLASPPAEGAEILARFVSSTETTSIAER